MCDGVTQGRDGMELSLFSRDNIAQGAAIALSHDMYDSVIHLGVCDKIVPGLLIAALRFGWLPQILPQLVQCRPVYPIQKKRACVRPMLRARRRAKNYLQQKRRVTTRLVPAHFTAQPIPIRC